MWDDWEQQLKDNPEVEVDKRLLWEYNMKDFDWQKSRHIVVERVVNVGGVNPKANMLALFKMYGGYNEVRKIIQNEVVRFSNFGEEYVCDAFHLNREDLKSYKRKQERVILFGEPVDKTDWW